MNIKIDKLQSLHILTDVVDHNELAGLQGGAEERILANHFPSRATPFEYEPTRPYREFMEFTIDGHYHHHVPIDRCDVTVNREDESNYRFSEIGRIPRITQSVRVVMPFNNDTADAVIELSDSVRLGIHNAIRTTFDVVVRRYDPTGLLITTVHFRGCTVTSIETEEGHKATFIIHPEAIFYV
jgi:hypothetical protein